DPWAQGMSYVGSQLEQILDDMGVSKFDPAGQDFNAAEHEAIERVESEQPEGMVLETTLPGYKIAGRVVRPATVRVSSGHHNDLTQEVKSPPQELSDV
ncbi:MAG: molecular chaperone GrpE, partial [Candidatus Dependentiae bacterium]|nr:molecular chaperone GrpE [Candidatus Dependentiae bacterium]